MKQINLFGFPTNDNKVKLEHTSRRDMKLLKRHRLWGMYLNQEDIDFLEYDKPTYLIALIEYKTTLLLKDARLPQAGEENYANLIAMTTLANKAQLPFFLVFYNPDLKFWRMFSANEIAKKNKPPEGVVTEYKYVEFLYWLRGRALPDEIKSLLFGGGY